MDEWQKECDRVDRYARSKEDVKAREKKIREEWRKYRKDLARRMELDRKMEAENPGVKLCSHTCILHKVEEIYYESDSTRSSRHGCRCDGVPGERCKY